MVYNRLTITVTHLGNAKPQKRAKPKMKRFLLDWIEQFFKFEIPTPVIIPNITQKSPPTTGFGIVTKIEANFPKRDNPISKAPAINITCLKAKIDHLKSELRSSDVIETTKNVISELENP